MKRPKTPPVSHVILSDEEIEITFQVRLEATPAKDRKPLEDQHAAEKQARAERQALLQGVYDKRLSKTGKARKFTAKA